ncbi:hypothetical protein OIDMADRAFT_135229 [Oidiodendron maius Zn]|uniref:Zn(2)-C6 fungal-type domain-containing protein n=1 Tax=Oidiodendron maius (strain Zn) TaxID=913774 RepID=A0A0C3GWZ9_OIDMZ|nr:hypothetical protein OIDMADRAFT_135229 [Oidiodendron maius Zn]
MPRVALGQRKRAYRPKTRTGCNTCKIKCDEALPYCLKCISTGRKCEGFEPQSHGNFIGSDIANISPQTLIRSPSIGFLGSEKERRSFHFFKQRTAAQLSSFFGGDFWERLLLQTTHHEPSVRHAIIALGALHERFEQDNGLVVQSDAKGWTDDFALKNYNQAIKLLNQSLSSKGQQAIDTMQGSYGPAITHVQSGMKILCEAQNGQLQNFGLETSAIPYVPMEMLEELFMRLDLQVTQMVGEGGKWQIYKVMKKYAWTRKIPPFFSSLSQARDSLVFHWHMLSYSISDVRGPTNEQIPDVFKAWQKSSIGILEKWSAALNTFLFNRGDDLTDIERKGVAVLTILKELGSTSVMLTRTMVDDQKAWDIFTPTFQRIVSLAEEIVELEYKSNSGRPTFSIDMAIVGPIFEVSCRCRDPLIRRRAITLLQTCGRTEGVWNSLLASKVAQRVLEIEEAGLTGIRTYEDIPDWARISDITPVFDHVGRKATLTYSRPGTKHSLARKTVQEVIEW